MPKGIPNTPRSLAAGPDGGQQPAAEPKITRAEAVRTERRRKPGHTSFAGIKLAVDESKLDRGTYHYRFAADKGARMQQLTADDYDVAPEMGAKPDSNGLGSVSTALAGTDESGRPYNHVLMRKRRDWFEADQREKQKPLDAMEEAMRRGNVKQQNNPNVQQLGDGAYTPNGVNIIERA